MVEPVADVKVRGDIDALRQLAIEARYGLMSRWVTLNSLLDAFSYAQLPSRLAIDLVFGHFVQLQRIIANEIAKPRVLRIADIDHECGDD